MRAVVRDDSLGLRESYKSAQGEGAARHGAEGARLYSDMGERNDDWGSDDNGRIDDQRGECWLVSGVKKR